MGSYTYRRLMLHFVVDDAALACRLPEPWRPLHSGAFGNLTLSFIQVLATEDKDGRPLPATPRYLAYNGTAHDPATGNRSNFWYAAFATDPDGLLGWSRAAAGRPAPARIDLSFRHDESAGRARVTETWRVDGGDGRVAEVEIDYQPGPLRAVQWKPTLRSAKEPSFWLQDVNDELRDTVKDVEEGVDRIDRWSLEVLDGEWSGLLGGLELRGATAVPWAHRRVFVPDKEEAGPTG